MKRLVISALILFVAVAGNAKKKWAITTTGESLQALTQVTDNEEPCLYPFGGDNGAALFFVFVKIKGGSTFIKRTILSQQQ